MQSHTAEVTDEGKGDVKDITDQQYKAIRRYIPQHIFYTFGLQKGPPLPLLAYRSLFNILKNNVLKLLNRHQTLGSSQKTIPQRSKLEIALALDVDHSLIHLIKDERLSRQGLSTEAGGSQVKTQT